MGQIFASYNIYKACVAGSKNTSKEKVKKYFWVMALILVSQIYMLNG